MGCGNSKKADDVSAPGAAPAGEEWYMKALTNAKELTKKAGDKIGEAYDATKPHKYQVKASICDEKNKLQARLPF